MSRRRALPLLVMLLALLAGCSGVPLHSKPEAVRSVERGNDAASQPSIGPLPGAAPRDLVAGFLRAGVAADAGHSASRQFLTNDAARKWQDGSVTILEELQVNNAVTNGDSSTVEVTGRQIGQLDAGGTYSPVLKNVGVGDTNTFSFGLSRVGGQWRIDRLQPGVLIDESSFISDYKPRPLYFFDSTESVLVPDLRYSALGGGALATWLVGQLVAGPRPELAQSVLNEVPDQVDPRRVLVSLGDPIKVEMPGSGQLDRIGSRGLAAQLAFTLSQVQFGTAAITLTDSGKVVTVPGVGVTFDTTPFSSLSTADSALDGQAYYVRDGALISGLDDKPVTGALGQPTAGLGSVAVRRQNGDLSVAAVSGNTLRLGTSSKVLPVGLPAGALSRPEWRTGDPAVWIGSAYRGGSIFRVGANRRWQQVSVTSSRGGLPPGAVLALRFSPDGVRVVAVIKAADGTQQAWIGSVVTSGPDVRIDSVEAITPTGLAVSDVGWFDATTLVMVAVSPNDEVRVWRVQTDGSLLDPDTTAGLPGSPDAIAAAPGQVPLVSASNSIWYKKGSTWVPYGGIGTTAGENPVYAP